jgi:DNA polymerase (family X)
VVWMSEASQVASLLNEFGRCNPYRAKAYLRAAERVALLTEPLDDLVRQQRLREIPGVGEAIAGVITELCQTGSHPSLEKMRADVPESVLELLTIPSLRPDKIMKLHKELGISTIEELETAVKEDRLKPIKGLGLALQRKILAGLEARQSTSAARHVHRAEELLSAAEASFKRSNLNLRKIMIAGDLRRGCELVSDLALAAEQPAGKTARLKFGELTLHVAKPSRFGAALLFATGSESHVDQLQKLARKKGFSLDETGLYRGEALVAARTETEIYGALGLSFIEPELREGRGEIALARKKQLPKLIRAEDIVGILHAHTTASDGVILCDKWQKPRTNEVTPILVSPITPSLHITLAGLASRKSSPSMSSSMS